MDTRPVSGVSEKSSSDYPVLIGSLHWLFVTMPVGVFNISRIIFSLAPWTIKMFWIPIAIAIITWAYPPSVTLGFLVYISFFVAIAVFWVWLFLRMEFTTDLTKLKVCEKKVRDCKDATMGMIYGSILIMAIAIMKILFLP